MRAKHDALVRLVERLLTAQRAAPDADTTAATSSPPHPTSPQPSPPLSGRRGARVEG